MLQRTETGRRQCQVVPRRLIDDGEGVARNSSPADAIAVYASRRRRRRASSLAERR